MPSIEISEDQRAFLDSLRDELAAEHAGRYGHVRDQDALQYLIDAYESLSEVSIEGPAENGDGEVEDEGADDGEAVDPSDRLTAMMQLLETHENKWTEAEGGDARYEVELPGGGTEAAQTKDDVRALLYKHYG